ncbi:PREDICTED: gem-associated protein 2 [Nicrophorus vespilloides]|uniref:Gem-associated protein 2 n=1 Tax=Nicrophorus vespilloides TaxID=110193 RepID=A0ABM1M4T6_NICVS|nr:PREDICTED: gem-associated protein 2 [Nicrophorus vespilloides]
MDSDSSDCETGMLKRALHVDLPADFDPNKIPQNGEEYLQSVMFETKMCQKVVMVPLDERKKKNVNYTLPVREECTRAPNELIPSLEWQEEKVKDFEKFRKFLASKNLADGRFVEIITDRWIPTLRERTPRYTEIVEFNQPSKIKLLQVILDEIERSSTLGYNMSVWIYAILATLELPLFPEICHQLRELARKCSKIRANLTTGHNEETLNELNLTICLVARYFRQLDLADGGF